jgi:hypothetical protein
MIKINHNKTAFIIHKEHKLAKVLSKVWPRRGKFGVEFARIGTNTNFLAFRWK